MSEIVIAVVAALPGLLAAGVALYQTRRTAKKDEVSLLREMVDNASDNEEKMEKEIIQLQSENKALTQQVRQLEQNLNFERRSRALLTQRVDELVAENHKLHQYIGELRERVRKAGGVHPEAISMMKLLPSRIEELAKTAEEKCGQQEITDEINRLSSYAQSIALIAHGPNGE